MEFASVPTIFRLDIAASFNISYVHQNLYQPLQKTIIQYYYYRSLFYSRFYWFERGFLL